MPYKNPEKSNENKRLYWIKNKKEIYRKRKLKSQQYNITRRKHRLNNPEIYKRKDKERYDRDRERLLLRKKVQYQKYKKRILLYEKKHEKECPSFLIGNRLRARLRRAISQQYRKSSMVDLLGCSFEEFRKHI